MSTGISAGADRETALTVIPKNELAVVAQQAGTKADKLEKVGTRFVIGALSGGVLSLVGLFVVSSMPILIPVVGMAGIASTLVGSATGFFLYDKGGKAREQQRQAFLQRTEPLIATAKSALDGAIADGTVRAGLDLPIESQNETPKRIHVEDMGAIVTPKGEKKLKVNAKILEEDGTNVVWMIWNGTQEDHSKIYWEPTVAAFPKAVLDSIWAGLPPADAASATAPQPIVQEPEKKLPPYTPGLGG